MLCNPVGFSTGENLASANNDVRAGGECSKGLRLALYVRGMLRLKCVGGGAPVCLHHALNFTPENFEPNLIMTTFILPCHFQMNSCS